MFTFIGIGHRHAFDGMIHRFGAAGCKNDFFGHGGIDQLRYRFTRLFQGFGGFFPVPMLAGRVMVIPY